jgi:hypothetical protein
LYLSLTIPQIITLFIKKGGTVNKYYLQEWNKNKSCLVYLNGWYKGKNIKEAMIKAMS